MNILIADTMYSSLFNMFEEHDWQYSYQPAYKRQDIIDALPQYDGLVIRSKTFVDAEVLEAGHNLKFIARAGAGLDLIDLTEAQNRNIEVFHAGEGNRDAVAEQAVGMLLALFNNIIRADRQVRQGIWDREGNRGVEIMNKTVGIIGYGNNGSATAKRLSGFGCKVLAYDKCRDRYGDAYARQSTIEEIMEEADILSLHIPLTAETKFMVNDSFVEGFAKPFYLLNLSRGETAQIGSIVKGLQSGKIKGACLDVLENEKLSKLTPDQQQAFDYLCSVDNVVLTPHIGGWTHESYHRINEVLVRQIAEWALVKE